MTGTDGATRTCGARGWTGAMLAVGLLLGCGGGNGGSGAGGGPGGGRGGGPGGAAPPVPVQTARVETVDLPVVLEAVGSVAASATVGLRPQVGGELTRVLVREGQPVKAGELLFELDARPLTAALRQAEAARARDRANLEQARRQQERYATLAAQDFASKEQADQLAAAAAAAAAALQVDEAQVEQARLQLAYTQLRAPLSGRAGELVVDAGNLVRAGDPALVTVHQLRPVHVVFSVPEAQLPAVRRGQAAGALLVEVTELPETSAAAPAEASVATAAAAVPSDASPPPATGSAAPGAAPAQAATAATEPLRGELFFIDPAVDRTTGTVRLKAQFANEDETLWPGQFVRVQLVVGRRPGALVVPAAALQQGQQGPYVFVIDEQLTAGIRPVTPGLSDGGRTEILAGLAAGETVVTNGHLRLFPGAKIRPAGPPGSAGPAATTGAPR